MNQNMKKNLVISVAILTGSLSGCTSEEELKCQSGEVLCRTQCIDPMTSKRFCGADEACENFQKCGSSQYCVKGVCSDEPDQTCPKGYLICGNECLDPSELNLSKCNVCKKNYEDCNHDMSDGCEVNLRNTRTDCGSCGYKCEDGNSCRSGKCQKGCQSNEFLCDGVCLNRTQNHLTDSCEECQSDFGNCNGDIKDGCETDLKTDPENCGVCGNTCPPGKECANGSCQPACDENEKRCDGVCVKFSSVHMFSCTQCETNYLNCDHSLENGCEVTKLTDPNHCGNCFTACSFEQRCVKGKCVSGCDKGQTSCQVMGTYSCVDLKTDPFHCGACNHFCKPEKNAIQMGCSEGACLYECMENKTNCGTSQNPICVDFNSDPENCGGCHNQCEFPGVEQSICTNGSCSIDTCKENFANCNQILQDGCETNILSDTSNCGECGHKCSENEFCNNGKCSSDCESPLITCQNNEESAICTDPRTDAKNCGECSHACESKPLSIAQCSDSHCTYVCETGYKNCGTPEAPVCIDIKTSMENCGACGNACLDVLTGTQTAACQNGLCQYLTCKDNYADCNDNPFDGCEANTKTSVNACGGCLNNCIDGVCNDGVCCIPQCESKECGSDGCGGSCGSCQGGGECLEGQCVFGTSNVGCSDGTREGFKNINTHPQIAGCSGAWTIPGLHQPGPACDRKSGNSGENPNGTNCNVEDLCAEGWHVCLGKDDVKGRTVNGCANILDENDGPYFFAARTSSSGSFNCTPDTVGSSTTNTDDFFGCGNMGCAATQDTCTPLQFGSHDLCIGIVDRGCTWTTENEKIKGSGPQGCNWCKTLDYWNYVLNTHYETAWHCGSNTTNEANNVTKSDPNSQGGVLCCKNQCNEDGDCPNGTKCEFNVCK